jgi:diguanylate cyclase (GGDEF)-like protein
MAVNEMRDARAPLAAAGGTRRLRSWLVASVVLLILGTTGAVTAAGAIARRDADRARVAFTTSAAQVASTLQLAIQHEQDLIISAAAFIAANPNATKADFAIWIDSVQALQRYPELLGLGQAVLVTQSELAAFEARSAPAGGFNLQPPGVRPFYCFSANGVSRSGQPAITSNVDVCAGSGGVAGLAARDTGRGAYLPFADNRATLLVVLSPVYRLGAPVATVPQRRAAFLSWVGTEVVPKVVLDRALVGHAGLAVTFTYAADSSKAAFHAGTVPNGADSVTTDLHNGWTVRTFDKLPPDGIVANGTALTVLLGGIALSLLLAALLFVLATGRVRALALVREKTDELRHQALHDELTNLPNRALIMDRIEQMLARNLRDGTHGAALYVDLDDFKNINDTLGHGAGDQLLQAVALRLTASLRDVDTIGRMGGDEFVVLLEDAPLACAAELVAQRLLDVMRLPFHLDRAATPVVINASVGIAVGHRTTPEELLREADVALYQAKAAGRNCYETFRPEMGKEVSHRFELESDLRSALVEDQYRLVYQPVYNLDDLSVVGVEALLRWDHPEIGEIEPGDFIPLLESTGQIIEVGRWVLEHACAQMARWRERGSDLFVSVNISARQLDRDVIIEDVRAALHTSGLDPAALTLEITETALTHNVDSTARRLRELKALGIQVAIDDFGTGYASLAYLQRFPIDCLKIDRSFTEAITRSPASDALVHTLVRLGKDLGLRTLAEGVEHPEQIEYLRGQSVDAVQGFLLAKPLRPEAIEAQIIEPALASAPHEA